MKKFVSMALVLLMLLSAVPMSVFAATMGTDDYYTVISEEKYSLAPGATETELVVNNKTGDDRKVVHYFEVDTKNPDIEVLPGYYAIDKLDPDNLALDGVVDKKEFWSAKELTKTVAYYEGLGYNVVGAMNTALAYDSDAPYGYMVMNGVVLGTPQVHSGAKTYLAIDAEGNCELRSMSTPLDGSEVTAISANFGWLVKDGQFVDFKTVERTSSDASRSMIGIKADGTLVFCQVDGRNAPVSTGLSNYEMGEMMLALGCVNAVNCDGGGSSTFVSKREGETENIMRSVPSDGSERATINSVIIVSNAKPTGEFDHAVLDTEYDYYAPGTSAIIDVKGVDAAGTPAELPAEGITWALSDNTLGTVVDGVFTSNGTKGSVDVQMLYNGEIVGEKTINVVDPDVFAFTLDETVLPYGKSMNIEFACTYGADDWAVCVDGAYTLKLSDDNAATLDGNKLIASDDYKFAGVDVTATYTSDPTVTDVLKISYGKGSEVVFDFEDGDISNFLGVDEMYDWASENGAPAPIQSNGNYSEDADSFTFLSSDVVKSGEHSLGVTLDYTDAQFADWCYNMFFYTGENVVLRDVANGNSATTLGAWVYIPEGAAGLAMQIQGVSKPDGTGGTGAHFYFTTASGAKKNLNSCTEADIPESRWVYATVDLTQFGDYFATYPAYGKTGREPSFIRFYVKPTTAANLTFYYDDFTLDYSSAVDDRVLPTITNVSYANADTAVALENNAVINSGSMTFSAVVADNVKLDNSTAKILVDGNELNNVSISGKYLASEQVTLVPGIHTVAFEIADTLGNLARVTRTFTVSGDAPIVLSGHNDSGALAEVDSIYYVDVNVTDIANINKLTTDLRLQSANTWELEGMTVANGFDVTYELNEVENIVSLTIERNGEEIDETATTLVSIPVRLWSWGGVNHVNDTPITPETQYATGYCPIVNVECKVLSGAVEFVKGYNNYLNAFGGKFSVATKINDIVYAWHVHDKELTVLNKDAKCGEAGYTGRTYCETCKSVIDWGTVIEKTGHNYVVDGDVLGCDKCDDTINSTGIVTVGDNMYYLIGGKLATGWQSVGFDWVYADPDTKCVATGDTKISGITFKFDENGILTTGTWLTNSYGKRYYYGPSYYKRTWQEIDGATYWFTADGYTVSGYVAIKENVVDDTIWYVFAEDGKLIERVTKTGFIEMPDGLHYVENGVATHAGLVEIDGDYYYVNTECKAVTGEYTIKEGWTNGLLPAGTYTFGEDGKMIIVKKDGFVTGNDGNLYYYDNDVLVKTGLTKIDGAYYYLSTTNGKVAVNVTRQVAYNCIDASAKDRFTTTGTYTFGADGKMILEKRDGFVKEADGNLYYYKNDVIVKTGLTKIDGYYYYLSTTNGKVAVNVTRQVAYNCIDASAKDRFTKTGTYTFGSDGKMVIE